MYLHVYYFRIKPNRPPCTEIGQSCRLRRIEGSRHQQAVEMHPESNVLNYFIVSDGLDRRFVRCFKLHQSLRQSGIKSSDGQGSEVPQAGQLL